MNEKAILDGFKLFRKRKKREILYKFAFKIKFLFKIFLSYNKYINK